MARRVHIGTSGWQYQHWKARFYPADLPQKKWLEYYAARIDTVEINSSFYAPPSETTVRNWRARTPAEFVFTWKAGRVLTHRKKLKDAGDMVPDVLARAEELGDKLGPVLIQLPPRWKVNPDRLREFFAAWPGGRRVTLEFRDPSWFTGEVLEILTENRAALCLYEIGGQTAPEEVTADFVYVRLHGPGRAYQGNYSDAQLGKWADFFRRQRGRKREVFCYFDNDDSAYAVHNALRLREMLHLSH